MLEGIIQMARRNQVTVLTEYAGSEPPAEVPAAAIVYAEDVEGS